MFKPGVITVITVLYCILSIAFTTWHASHFSEYSDKKGDESLIYVVVISAISYFYYLSIFVAKKFNVIVILFVPFVYVFASVGLSILIALLAGETTTRNFYICTLSNIVISVFLVQAMKKEGLYKYIRSRKI